jgi:hypothetical protein
MNGHIEQIMAIRIPRGVWAAILTVMSGFIAGLLVIAAVKN